MINVPQGKLLASSVYKIYMKRLAFVIIMPLVWNQGIENSSIIDSLIEIKGCSFKFYTTSRWHHGCISHDIIPFVPQNHFTFLCPALLLIFLRDLDQFEKVINRLFTIDPPSFGSQFYSLQIFGDLAESDLTMLTRENLKYSKVLFWKWLEIEEEFQSTAPWWREANFSFNRNNESGGTTISSKREKWARPW